MWRHPEEHAVYNVGSTDAHVVLFEVKEGGMAHFGAADLFPESRAIARPVRSRCRVCAKAKRLT
jgi:hypothetical protein